MGKDKSQLLLGGVTLLQRVVLSVLPLVSETIVILSKQQSIPPELEKSSEPIKFGIDSVPKQGPLQGIADAIPLLSDKAEFVFVLSCDLPHLTSEWLVSMREKLSMSSALEIVCSANGDHLNPLISVYRADTIKRAKELVESGNRSCLALLDDCSHSAIKPPQAQSYLIENINTPQEYKQALSLFDEMN